MIKKQIEDYSDIIEKEYIKDNKRPQMSNLERGAQFAPFAPLTGHRDKIKNASDENDNYVDMNETFYEDI